MHILMQKIFRVVPFCHRKPSISNGMADDGSVQQIYCGSSPKQIALYRCEIRQYQLLYHRMGHEESTFSAFIFTLILYSISFSNSSVESFRFSKIVEKNFI